MSTYYTDHSALLGLPRWVSFAEGGTFGAGLWLFVISWQLAIVVAGIGAAAMAVHAVLDCDAMCSRRFERRRVAKIEADQAAGIWPRRELPGDPT